MLYEGFRQVIVKYTLVTSQYNIVMPQVATYHQCQIIHLYIECLVYRAFTVYVL